MHVFVSGRVYFCIISVSIFDRAYFSCLLVSKIDVFVSISAFVSIYRVYFYFCVSIFKKQTHRVYFPCLFFKGIANDAEIDAAPACLFFKIVANTHKKNT